MGASRSPSGRPCADRRCGLVEQEVPDLGALEPNPVSDVVPDPRGCQLVGLLGLLARVPQAHRDHSPLSGLGEPVGLESRLAPEDAEHPLPCHVADFLRGPGGHGVHADANVAHRILLPTVQTEASAGLEPRSMAPCAGQSGDYGTEAATGYGPPQTPHCSTSAT